MAARKKTISAKKTAAKTAKPAPAKAWTLPKAEGRAAGEKRYWLVKTEPSVFSFDDLMALPNKTTFWDGIRNYQARNFLRDQMKQGDGLIVYHSSAEPPAAVGIAEVAREGYPDATQFDPKHDHYDPDSKQDDPRWFMIDVRGVKAFSRPIPLAELRELPGLEKMVLLQKGSRLSVQPVSPAEWTVLTKVGGIA